MQDNFASLHRRYVSFRGETLVVGEFKGVKALFDPCDQALMVVVPPGCRAKLVCFSFVGSGLCRDACVLVTQATQGLVFVLEECPVLKVALQQLEVGQLVDVFPSAEPEVAYMWLPRVPSLTAGVAVQAPVYACA